jgi:hypothetical protein
LGLSLCFFAFGLLCSVATELLTGSLSIALCDTVSLFLTDLLGVKESFFMVSTLMGGGRVPGFAALLSIALRLSCLPDASRSRPAILKRLPLSLEQLLELALESLDFVESTSEFFRIISIVVVIAVGAAAATGTAGSIIAVVIVVVARVATPIVFVVAMPLNDGEPLGRHFRCLALVVSPAEGVLCKIVQHSLKISILDCRTDKLSHYCFRCVNVMLSYRVATSPSTGWRVSHASDGHSIGVD